MMDRAGGEIDAKSVGLSSCAHLDVEDAQGVARKGDIELGALVHTGEGYDGGWAPADLRLAQRLYTDPWMIAPEAPPFMRIER
jgi:hypothetical protein